MKYVPLILITLLVIASAAWGIRSSRTLSTTGKMQNHPATANSLPPVPPFRANGPPQPNLWREYQADRTQTLRTNPELAAEYQSILAEIHQQQIALDAAMIKADPSVAPVVAKLELIRKRNAPPAPGLSK